MPELHWLGDDDAKRAARRVPYRLLEPVKEKRTIGEVWAAASNGRCLFTLVTDAQSAGKSMADQLRDAIRRSP